MNPFLSIIIRSSIAIPVAFVVWLISYLGFDQTFLLSSVISVSGGILLSYTVKIYLNHLFLKKQKLTRKEYKYIKKNLDEAKQRISRLQKALFSFRQYQSIKQRKDLILITKKIYDITKKEPKRFYQAEKFYFSHLESLVELTEKYVFLSRQLKKTRELEQSLDETRQAIKDLSFTIEKDLHQIISGDIEQLNFELDVVKHLKSNKDSVIPNESRKL
ncbi:5-bromo-4-chloroindolyl phosphate hydrolysis family protein [Neobacillus sp. PS3-40]|uniref:5-bromo-4-chloroindolyl phosphate hydrolysis family protein n=1 Tax=Neobacillus sp. PS3-40 TaxID=3070679 RepID=UPI0027E03CBF|nr:5-bromo-4-chloroindolyl phosphate hydrolysis family protein [Neobacillus sp. PS3-40]WML42902.1 5-bromo-4-chloroindolyl phosphate hydrolysis family protein [Neobacillus sp. PS3-40]